MAACMLQATCPFGHVASIDHLHTSILTIYSIREKSGEKTNRLPA